MIAPTATRRPRAGPAGGARRVAAVAVGFVLAMGAAWAVGGALFGDVDHVRRVTIANPTDYDVNVTIAGYDDGVVLLGTTKQQCTSAFDEVLDAGDSWTFRFAAQGRDGGAITISRVDLEANGWQVPIPVETGSRLAAAGAPLPPPGGCR